jgi:hypothetical protein
MPKSTKNVLLLWLGSLPKIFFSKMYFNNHCMTKVIIFCVDQKSKVATITGQWINNLMSNTGTGL